MKKKVLTVILAITLITGAAVIYVYNALFEKLKEESVLLEAGETSKAKEEKKREDYEFPDIPPTHGDPVKLESEEPLKKKGEGIGVED